MKDNISNNKMALGSSAFTAFLCILFGANAVAIKFSLTGLGPFTNAGFRYPVEGRFLFPLSFLRILESIPLGLLQLV